jgi:phosphoenolpyruvate phosphomutase
MTGGSTVRALIQERGLVRLMAAHSPLSAILVEEAGFEGIWASGFELSALYGLPDNGLISMTQHLDMVRAMAGATTLPIIADIDTGFGNAANVMHAIEEYERAGAAGVVMEDKTFPKTSSLAVGGRHDLVGITEFQGKVEAALAARRDPAFVVIARTEALIAGLGEEEALRRASAYARAGADLVFVHSKAKSPGEIESFVRRWDGARPLVLVPTAFPEMNEGRIRASGKVGMVIYGNHGIRASVAAMQAVFRQVATDGGIQGVQDKIASVDEIFRLQRASERAKKVEPFLRGGNQ